ncbi:MAG: SUMF1/EgtB/PvdO family nonheme iron enzyme [Haliscomenobacter sp.]|nr:SUMF1/EgtB/PvdO family nonheme iron enzyme [Haliscomenobacter sp.]
MAGKKAEFFSKKRRLWLGRLCQQGGLRVVRGGSWNNNTRNCRAANRNRNNPDNRNNNNGFRLAREYARPNAGARVRRGSKSPLERAVCIVRQLLLRVDFRLRIGSIFRLRVFTVIGGIAMLSEL